MTQLRHPQITQPTGAFSIAGVLMCVSNAGEAMRRRTFIALVGMYLALPIAAQAQEAGRIYSVGGLSAGSRTAPYLVAVFEELRRAGFIEGTNLIIDWRTYGSNIDPIPEFVAELVKARVALVYEVRQSVAHVVEGEIAERMDIDVPHSGKRRLRGV